MINWTAGQCPVSRHFTVRELLWLPTYGRLAQEDDFTETPWATVLANLQALAAKMDDVRDWAACPLRVHVTVRPPAYNLKIGGAPNSAHKVGLAMDFDPSGYKGNVGVNDACAAFISDAIPLLESWGMRCEDNGPLPGWVHLDLFSPNPNRYFKP